jgi:hypothetical protein
MLCPLRCPGLVYCALSGLRCCARFVALGWYISPFQGSDIRAYTVPQGVALGWYISPFQGSDIRAYTVPQGVCLGWYIALFQG